MPPSAASTAQATKPQPEGARGIDVCGCRPWLPPTPQLPPDTECWDDEPAGCSPGLPPTPQLPPDTECWDDEMCEPPLPGYTPVEMPHRRRLNPKTLRKINRSRVILGLAPL